MLYIGIDPGEVWCGFAALETTAEGIVRVESRTYSVTARKGYLGMARDIVELLPHSKKTMVVVEDFRVRRVGHQGFNAANTLRLIGALEYGVSEIPAFHFSLVPPSDHGERDTKELFGRVLLGYRKQWPSPGDAAWKHCLSAWRVLGMHLMNHDRELLLAIREKKKKKSHRCARWLPVLQRSQKLDHVAPAARWIKPKA